jgi:alcohol dehydrogenase YqhD (iron-dependent ADH family)
MYDFVFQNSTKILFGKGILSAIGRELAVFGRTVLLVYGRQSIKANGIYHQIIQSMENAGITVVEHSGVSPNPTLDHVRKGISAAKKNKVDAVAAVGGGSVMDSAKAIAAGAGVDHDVWKFFIGKKKISRVLPVICVPTLAASGSEMNSAMVITNPETKQKFGFANRHLYPRVSLLDPVTTFSVPSTYTAYGAVDIITHLLESYFTTRLTYSPLQDSLMEGVITTVMESCNNTLKNQHDYDSRANLMWCGAIALSGYPGSGLGKVDFPMHLIEHSLSGLYDIPHGAGLSVVVPGWLRYQEPEIRSKLAQFASRIFASTSGDEKEKSLQGIAHLTSWFEAIGCPTRLEDLHIENSAVPDIATHALSLAKIWRLHKYGQKEIENVLNLCCKL